LTINFFGQKIIEYKIDDNLRIQIPENYEIKDTLEQKVVKAFVDNGLILIITSSNIGKTAATIKNEKDLLKFYKGFRAGHIKSLNGKLINEEFVNKDGLKLYSFSYIATMGEEVQLRNCLVLFLQDNTYILQFWQPESMKNEMKIVNENFFSSLKISKGFTLENQLSFSNEEQTLDSYSLGYTIGKIFGKLLVLGIVIGLIILIAKKINK